MFWVIKLYAVKTNKTSIRVRYGETDQMGVVYHANYVNFFEIGRTEWLRSLGYTYKSLEASGVFLPVIGIEIDYKKSAKYDDELTVESSLIEKPNIRIQFSHKIFNQEGDLLVTGISKLVFLDKKNNRPVKCPKFLLNLID